MSTQYAFGKIVTNGLVLALDAADRNSYVSGSTSWIDLTGNGKTGSLINGPTYSSTRGGAIVFDGVNDFVQYGTGSGITTDWTVSVWFYSFGIVNYKNVIDCNYGYSSTIGNLGPRLEMSSNGNLAWIWSGDTSNGNNYYYTIALTGSIAAAQPNVWYNAVITRTSANAAANYINGVLKSNTVTTVGTPSATFINRFDNIVVGKGFGAFGQTDRNLSGSISIVQIYNRALSAQEVLQNYNAQKARFGL